MNIHDAIAEKVETAASFAADGAFQTASRLLREAADLAQAHHDTVYRAMFGRQPETPAAQLYRAREGVEHLKRARLCFEASGNLRTLERVRLAISSAKGAVRICGYRENSLTGRGGARG